jgi:sn-glycerol 3-phosphate transport system permease protein
MRNNRQGLAYLMIAPTMLGVFAFVIYPMAYLIRLSLWNTNLLNQARNRFVGTANYHQLFGRADFWKVLRNTAVYTGVSVLLIILLALMISLLIQKSSRFNALTQACIFTPHIVSILSISIVWLWLMNPDHGLLNYLLKLVGQKPLKWVQSSDTAMMSIIIVSVWKSLGYYALILVSAIKAIPDSIYEAAELDNAPTIRVFFRITLPLLSPQLFFILIMLTISSFKVFETVRVMTLGGPNNATNTLVFYIYNNVFTTMRIGLAASAGVVLMVIISILTLIYFALLSKRVHYQ